MPFLLFCSSRFCGGERREENCAFLDSVRVMFERTDLSCSIVLIDACYWCGKVMGLLQQVGQVASLNFDVNRPMNAYEGNDGKWIGILLPCNLNYVRAVWLFDG